MKQAAIIMAAIAFSLAARPAYAIWEVIDVGTWPDTWPEELEPLREQARSLTGGAINLTVHEIPFTDREQFESAWPHILKVKSEGAPVILLRSSKERFFGGFDAGVVIRRPPWAERPGPVEPIPGDRSVRSRWIKATYIELVVDGEIVDLNRIRLPDDTPVIDERFQDGQK